MRALKPVFASASLFPYEVQIAPPIRPEHGKSGLQSGTLSKTNVIDNPESRYIAIPAPGDGAGCFMQGFANA
jgi:hypothetical protein